MSSYVPPAQLQIKKKILKMDGNSNQNGKEYLFLRISIFEKKKKYDIVKLEVNSNSKIATSFNSLYV